MMSLGVSYLTPPTRVSTPVVKDLLMCNGHELGVDGLLPEVCYLESIYPRAQ